MEKKKVIFDLDGTLLTADYDFEHNYFRNIYGDEAESFIPYIGDYLNEYENSHYQYNIDSLSKFMTNKTGFDMNPEIIFNWTQVVKDVPDEMEKGVLETLHYLKCSGKKIVVLTNWFQCSQVPRLKNAGIYDFFDEVITGDLCLKPHKDSYVKAMGDYKPEECLFIGDHIENDYIGPRVCGIESILYDKNDKHGKRLVKVKNINDIIKMY